MTSRNFARGAALLGVALLASCAAAGTAPAPLPSPIVVAGEYAGTVTDSVSGKEGGDVVFAQHGSALGGSMSLTSGQTTSTESVELTLNGSSFSGSAVMDVNGAACTFNVTGSFGSSSLTATYSGVSGCTNTGTWSLQQTCQGVPSSIDRSKTAAAVPYC